jgi:hypothetical protein
MRHVLDEIDREIVGQDENDVGMLGVRRHRLARGRGRGRRAGVFDRFGSLASPEARILRLAVRHHLGIDLRQGLLGAALLAPLHDRSDAIEHQPCAPGGAGSKACVPAGRQNLSAGTLIAGRLCRQSRNPHNEDADARECDGCPAHRAGSVS